MKTIVADGKPVLSLAKCHGDTLTMVCVPKADYAEIKISTGNMSVTPKADADSAKASCTVTKKSKDGKSVESVKVHVEIEGKAKPGCNLSSEGFPFVADPRAKENTYKRAIVMVGKAKVTDYNKDCQNEILKIVMTPNATFVKLDDKSGVVTVSPTKDTKPGKYDILVSRSVAGADKPIESKKMSFTVPEAPKPACPFIAAN